MLNLAAGPSKEGVAWCSVRVEVAVPRPAAQVELEVVAEYETQVSWS